MISEPLVCSAVEEKNVARRNDHSREELRAMALKAARDIVNESGVQKLTTRAVAQRMGYSAGTLYLIFENLDDLIFAVNTDTIADLRGKIFAVADSVEDPIERLKAMAIFYLQYGLDHENLWRLIFEHRLEKDEEIPDSITRETDAVLMQVVKAIGTLAPETSELELQGAAAAFWSGVHGVTHLAITDKLKVASDAAIRKVMALQVNVFMAGLAAKRAT
jgi:AcrR family transcriptional regulator